MTRSPTLLWVSGHRKHHIFQIPAVLELEAAMHQLLRQRASRLVQRRQDDIKDESSEFASLSSQSILKVFMIYLNSLVSSVYVCARERKSLFASQEAESGLKYDPALVQSMFLHTVLTGLQSDSIKVDMQPPTSRHQNHR